MKPIVLLLSTTVLAAALLGCVSLNSADHAPRQLRHVVAFKFKATATPAQIKEVEDAFVALKAKIPQIAAIEWGTNNSPENLNKGHTHCFILTFKSEKDREIYLPHPDHKAFGKLLGPVLEDVFVIDYWTK